MLYIPDIQPHVTLYNFEQILYSLRPLYHLDSIRTVGFQQERHIHVVESFFDLLLQSSARDQEQVSHQAHSTVFSESESDLTSSVEARRSFALPSAGWSSGTIVANVILFLSIAGDKSGSSLSSSS
jgi:hypothetical protein